MKSTLSSDWCSASLELCSSVSSALPWGTSAQESLLPPRSTAICNPPFKPSVEVWKVPCDHLEAGWCLWLCESQ